MKIGVLALQGAFIEHINILKNLNVDCFEIRQKKDIDQPFDGIIFPGGESTVMGKLLRELDLFEPIQQKLNDGLPVFGTCAGLLLLAKRIFNDDRTYFDVMDITAKRNAYGRQLGSFKANAEFKNIGTVPMTFIRAPYIQSVGNGIEVLSEVDGHIVAAKQNNCLVTAFHPELTNDISVHKYFLSIVSESICNK